MSYSLSSFISRHSLALILLLTILAFSNSITNGFTNWDDNEYIVNNPLIRDLSFEGIKAMFSNYYGANYHPFTALSNAIEYKLFKLNPVPYHFNNLLLHLLNIVLVFRLILMLKGKKEVASIVAVLFAIHPMHVESVSWLAERKDVLYAFFYLGTVMCYIHYLQKRTANKYLLFSLLLFLCALLSKSAAVTLPLLLVLIDHYLSGKRMFSLKAHWHKLPFFVLSLLFGLIAMHSQKEMEAVWINTAVFTFFDRIFLASYGIVFYLVKLVAPVQLSALHYYPSKIDGLLPAMYYLAPFLILLLVLLVFKYRKTQKLMSFGLLFFLIHLILVLQLIPVGQAIVSERYTYLAYIGPFFILAQGYDHFFIKQSEKSRPIFIALLGIVIYLLSLATFHRNKVWKDSITLFSDVIEKDPGIAVAYNNRGSAKADANDTLAALRDYNKAIALYPDYADAYKNRSTIKGQLKDYKGALEDMNTALEINPREDISYSNLGYAKMQLGDYEGAIAALNIAIEKSPDDLNAIANRIEVYKKTNKTDAAVIKDMDQVIAASPQQADVYNERGIQKGKSGDFNGAVSDFTHALELNPQLAQAHANRGFAFLQLNKKEDACKDFEEAMRLGSAQAQKMREAYCN